MYHHLRGEIVALTPTTAVVEAGGVGYALRIPLSTYDRLKGGKDACVFTHLHVRQEELSLFGFATVEEREVFRFLSSVSGVGPAIALAALCTLTPEEIALALSQGNSKTLQRVKGVGRKLAERMALELRDRVDTLMQALEIGQRPASGRKEGPAGGRPETPARPSKVVDAIAALICLGFDRKTAEERADSVYKRMAGGEAPAGADVDLELLIKECLRSR